MSVGFAPGDPTFFEEAIQRAYEDKCSLALYSENLELEVRRLRALVDDLGGDNNSFVDEWNILRRALEEAVQKEENLAKALAEAKASRKDAVLKAKAISRDVERLQVSNERLTSHNKQSNELIAKLQDDKKRGSRQLKHFRSKCDEQATAMARFLAISSGGDVGEDSDKEEEDGDNQTSLDSGRGNLPAGETDERSVESVSGAGRATKFQLPKQSLSKMKDEKGSDSWFSFAGRIEELELNLKLNGEENVRLKGELTDAFDEAVQLRKVNESLSKQIQELSSATVVSNPPLESADSTSKPDSCAAQNEDVTLLMQKLSKEESAKQELYDYVLELERQLAVSVGDADVLRRKLKDV